MFASAQLLIDEAEAHATVDLAPGDYGPLLLDKPVIVQAQGTTFWSRSDQPALELRDSGACVQNATLRSAQVSELALRVTAGAHPVLQNVRVFGAVEGLDGGSAGWSLPSLLELAELRHSPAEYALELAVPLPWRLVSRISGVTFDPPSGGPGIHEVWLRVRDLMQESLLIGEIEIVAGQLTRLIPLVGYFGAIRSEAAPAPIWLHRVPTEFHAPPPAPKPPISVPITPLAPPVETPPPIPSLAPCPLPVRSEPAPEVVNPLFQMADEATSPVPGVTKIEPSSRPPLFELVTITTQKSKPEAISPPATPQAKPTPLSELFNEPPQS